MDEVLRIDKWLWAVRIYKTRTMAGDACRAGKVKIQGQAVKPSRAIKSGDIIQVTLGPLNKTIQVKELIHNRVSAKLVSQSMLDITPEEEYERIKFMHEMKAGMRERGSGRPTKKERRDLDKLAED
ncbi:MAG: RNA-binding S4 domain-containing protein [Lentimicrobium sp.]|jgi:ribosome-associated heat shock protein Hsp15|nr:RNA-binding S4 domain-containing protein [Lentimicrobium sp.]MDD2527245.1 RNA-binding S4 domain-containing protein [Lentimicrobiaceae bacterium]MDD4596575.1 RNA-binding S4 domain-containing protein [Lentimicrobiaceae bacterium]MDY0024870.1 RNA-binding S4 domain-containing protein [Lentimicrobium sp.]HAH58037.1 RNA-binding protein [Bacteroidales bacterium]